MNTIELVQRIIDDFHLVIPVDLDKVIGSFADIRMEYGCDIEQDGVVEKRGDEYIIRIKNKRVSIDDPNGYRDRFTIAHELGHLFLGHIKNHEKLYREGANELEYEANDFAANLLMPQSEFIRSIYSNLDEDGYCDLEEVSKQFRVSISAVKTRGKFLGVFSW